MFVRDIRVFGTHHTILPAFRALLPKHPRQANRSIAHILVIAVACLDPYQSGTVVRDLPDLQRDTALVVN